MTSPHWAEGSVAVVGIPAGGSWLRCAGRWAPSFCSWEVGLQGRPCPSASSVPGFLSAAWGLAKDSPALWGHGFSGAFCGKCGGFPRSALGEHSQTPD